MDEIISERQRTALDQLDAVRYQKLMAKEVPVYTYIDKSGKGSPAWLPNIEYEDDSYITDEMLEDLRIKADNE